LSYIASLPLLDVLQVKAGNALAARHGFSKDQVHFMVADGMAPPFPDNSFDVVLSLESSTYMPDKR
jgi:tocopherol O-methyltransferase